MHRHLKRNLAIGTTVLAAAAFAGGAYAATQSTPSKVRQAFLTDVAKRLNVTPQQLTAALRGAADDQLNAAVKAGRITQAEANAIKQRIAKGITGPFLLGPLSLAPRALPVPPVGGPAAPLLKGPAAPRLLGGPALLSLPGHSPLGAAAKYLGLTDAQLFDQLSAGKTLAGIAKSRGKSVAGLKQAMFAAEKATLEQAVKDKLITPAEEQQALKGLSSKLASLINGSARPKAPMGSAAGIIRSFGKGAAGPNGRVFHLVPPPPKGP